MKYLIGLIMVMIAATSIAKDLGKFATIFAIREPDPVEYIKNTLRELEATGEIENYHQQVAKKIKKKLQNPAPIEGIEDTVDEREFYYDPTYVVQEDIKDHKGNILYQKGYMINPLAEITFGEDMIFLNGSSEAQKKWVKEYIAGKNAQIVLVSGSPIDLTEELNERVYFDQSGKRSTQLGIKQVPAIVSQEGMRLKIREIKLTNKE